MRVIIHDGGRAAAGFRGEAGDCAARAIAIATGYPYATACEMINRHARRERSSARRRGQVSSARNGVFGPTMRRVMDSIGWVWTSTMGIGTGCHVHLRADELPSGHLVVALSKHYTAVVDGVIFDTHDPSRGGSRCVYGYWREPARPHHA